MNAGQAFFGGSLYLGDYTDGTRVPLPLMEGGTRLIVGEPTVSSKALILPPMAFIGEDAENGPVFPDATPKYTFVNYGSSDMVVKDLTATTIATVSPYTCAKLFLVLAGSSSPLGFWAVHSSVAQRSSVPLDIDRRVFIVPIQTSVLNGFNLREYLNSHFRYDGTYPVKCSVTVPEGVMIGSDVPTKPAFDTGTFPTGSSMFLMLNEETSMIVGRGGNGGLGQDSPASHNAGPGQDGGDALVLRIDSILVNHGIIAAGGGGGGGGNAFGANGGGGGGGGAGFVPSLGGVAGPPGGSPGLKGGLLTGGSGGVGGNYGGAGGQAGVGGAQGSPTGGGGGGAGGQPGVALKLLTGMTVTKIVEGVITGGQTTF